MTTFEEVLGALGQLIAKKIGEPRYQLWFANHTRLAWHDDAIVVGVPNRFYQEWLDRSFRAAIAEAIEELTGSSLPVRFVIDPQLFQAHRRREQEHSRRPGTELVRAGEPHQPGSGHRCPGPSASPMTFETFVVGAGNRLAHAAALALVEQSEALAPTTLYGPAGAGKTHLLQAVCHALQAQGRPALLLSAEEFTRQFVQQVRERRAPVLRSRYRDFACLLVDDLHFLAHKKGTQHEFLYTLDMFTQARRPALVTLDRHPRAVAGLLPELVNRLLAGGVWQIHLPDAATRRLILADKARRLGLPLSEPVTDLLVQHISGSVRELEGALRRLTLLYRLDGRLPDLESVQRMLHDLMQAPPAITLEAIERAVSQLASVPAEALHRRTRSRSVCYPRLVVIYLARKHLGLSSAALARHFGGMHHSTILAAEKRVRQWLHSKTRVPLGECRWDIQDFIARVEAHLGAKP